MVGRRAWQLCGLALLAAAACFAVPLAADEPAAKRSDPAERAGKQAQEDSSLRYRRVYVPADRIDDWPRGGDRYVPMSSAEFQQLMKIVAAKTSDGNGPPAARIVSGRYTAQLSGDAELSGKLQMTVANDAAIPALAALSPCGIALSDPRWVLSPKSQRAVLGVDQDGVARLVVPRAGELTCDWSLHGRHEPGANVAFVLALPSAPSCQLVLDLPEAAAPQVDFGVITAGSGAPAGLRRWQIDFGGHTKTRLTIIPTGPDAAKGRPTVLRQSLVYDFSPRGLEVTARLVLDVHGQPLRRLPVDLDPALQLLEARLGESDIPWSPAPAAAGGKRTSGPSAANTVVLEFSEPLTSTQRVVQLRAVASLLPGQRRALPAVRPQGVFWQEGTATLLVPRPLALLDVHLADCRQTKIEPLPGTVPGDSLDLQYFAPDATIEVLVDRREPPLHLSAATSLVLSPRQVRGRAVVDCSVDEGERFTLTARLPLRWRVDAVESEPAGALEQWTVSQGAEAATLSVRLSRAITPKRPLRLSVSGHLSDSTLSSPIPHTELRMVDVPGAVWTQRVVALRCRDPYRLHLAGDEELARLDPARLDAATRTRLDTAAPELLYADDSGARRLEVSLLQESPRHAADISVALTAHDGQVRESYRMAMLPDVGGLDRILVHASLVRPQAPVWSIEDSPGERLRTRKLSPEQQREAGLSEGEIWEIVLERPRTHPFTLRGDRTLPFDGPVSAALVSVANLTEQRGILSVYSETGEPLAISNQRLKPIPTSSAESAHYNTLRAAFRYDPARDVGAGGPAPLTIARAADTAAAGDARVWRAALDARYDSDGRGLNAVTFFIENTGRRSVKLELPPESSEPQVSIDGARVRPSAEEGSHTFWVDLPPGERFPALRIEYATQQRPLGLWRSLSAPLPTINLPVHAWHAIVWTPPEYRVLTSNSTNAPDDNDNSPAEASWATRLFGPLARSSGRQAFDPLSRKDWLEFVGQPPARELARKRLAACLKLMGSVEADDAHSLLLEDLLAPLAISARSGGERVLIDMRALERSNLTQKTAVPDAAGADRIERGAARLLANNLALLDCGDALVVTTSEASRPQHDEIVELFGPAAGLVTAGPIKQRAALAMSNQDSNDAQGDGSGLLNLRRWTSAAAPSPLPWLGGDVLGASSAGRAGWAATHLDMIQASPPRVVIVNGSLWTASGWSLMLVIAAALWWWYPRRLRAWLLLLCVMVVAALLLPADAAPVATIALLGTCAAGLLAMLFSRRATPAMPGTGGGAFPPVTGKDPPSSTISQVLPAAPAQGEAAAPASTIARTTTTDEPGSSRSLRHRLTSWLLLALIAVPLAAQGAGDAPPPERIFTVLIPVNKDKQPEGDTWYVPLQLFKELHQRAAARSVEQRGWLITDVNYRGRLAWNGAHTRLEMNDLKAVYDVDVYARQTQLRFPLRLGATRLSVQSVTLDGRSVDPLWDEQGRVLLLDVAEPGHYRLEIAPRTVDQENEPTSILELQIPALPTARLELALPADAPAVEVPSALGSVIQDAESQTLTAQLGGPGRLSLSWPQPAAAAQGPVDVDQLVLLKVQPGAVTVETRLKLSAGESRVHRFSLLADPRLRLLPLSRDAAALMQVHTVAGDPQTIVIDLPRGASSEQELPLSFLWTDESGVGRLRLPLLAPLEARSYTGWLAVTVDPALKAVMPDALKLEAASVGDFAAHWATGTPAPDAIYHLPRGEFAWSISTTPRTPQTTAAQTLGLSCYLHNASVRFEADLESTGGHLFSYRVHVPEGFVARSVSLKQNEDQRLLRWSQVEDVLILFLNGPVDGSQQLSIRGDVPLTAAEGPLPDFHIEDCTVENYDVAIYRRPDVKVQVIDAEAMRELGEPDLVVSRIGDPSPQRFGHFYGAYQVVNPRAPSVWSVHADPSRSDVTEVITLGRKDGLWQATIDYRLRVLSGTVDVVRLQVPASLRGPFEIVPPQPYQLVVIPGSQQRQLVIRPREPVRDQLRLSIASPLAIADGDRVSVPVVVPLGDNTATSYVVLPKQVEREQVNWELRGLDPEPLPHDNDSPPIAAETVSTFRVTDPRFQAVLASLARIEKTPLVRLADVRVAYDIDGHAAALAAFDLEPAGLTRCHLSLPPNMTLVGAQVGGLPATLSAVSSGEWDLSLVSDQLPQRIEVLYRGNFGAPATGPQALPAPMLRIDGHPIDVQQTLWTVDPPPGLSVVSRQRDAERVSTLKQQSQRLESMTRMLSEVTSEESIDVLAPWYQRWMERLGVARREIEAVSPDSGPGREEMDNLLAENQRQQDLLAHRLRTSDLLKSASKNDARTDQLPDLWRWGLDIERAPLRLAQTGGAASLIVENRGEYDAELGIRVALAAAAAVCTWLLLRTAWGGRLADAAARWPQAIVVGAGLAAWLLLTPGVAGLLLAGAAVFSTLRIAGTPQ